MTRLRAAASSVVQSMWTSAKGAVQRVLGDGDDLLLWIVERLEPRQLLSAPEITPIPPMDSTETLWFTVYTDFYDADTEDSHWGTFDWGDGSSDDAGIASSGGYGYVSGSHVYADNGVYNATLTITDSGNESSQVPFTVTVANIAPRLIIAAPSVVNEGASFSLNLASKDPGPDTISNWSINWGDGSAPQNVAGSTTSVAHVYAAGPAQRTITVTATDEDGSYVSSALAPDPSFGTVGKVTTNFGSTDLGRAVAVQPDGKVVAVGAAFISSPLSYGIGVARYLSNGTLDTTFDSDGKVTTNITSVVDQAYGVAIQNDGKIVVVGEANGDFVVVRYNSNGSLDGSFDTDGIVTTNFGATETVRGVALQSDGKIVVVGSTSGNFAVARYNTNGSADTTFDGDGRLTTDFGASDSANTVTIQPDGKIVVAGGSNGNFAVARYSSTGVLDNTFDTDGKAIVTFSGGGGAFGVVVVSGKIVLGGSTSGNFAAARLNSNGSLDVTFDSDGKNTADMGGYESVNAAAIGSDGRIVVGATQYNDIGFNDFAIVRFASNGALDTTFGAGGKLNVDFSTSDNLYGLAIGPDGKTVAVGYNATSDFALVRLNPNNTVRVNDLPQVTSSTVDAITETMGTSAYFDFSDGDFSDTFTVAINWGDGTPLDTEIPFGMWPGGGNVSASHVFADDGLYNATLTITDSSGGVTNHPFTVTVSNVAPRLHVSASYPVYEGSPMTLRLSATDIAPDTVSSWTINWGDGTAPQSVPGAAPTVTHTYADGPTTNTVTVTAYDEDGNYSTSAIGLETTFGTFGKTLTDFGSAFDTANGIAVLPGGKVIVGGYTYVGGGADMVLARYTAAGVLDTSFSGDGKAVLNLGTDFDYILDLALQNDGKIVVAGWSGDNMALLRFNSNGDLDTTFGGGDGIVTTDFGSTDQAYTLTIAPDGKIVVAGTSNGNFAVARYLSDGSLDLTFDGDGKVTRELGGYDVAYDVAVMSDGRIVAVGQGSNHFAILRFQSNGALDTTFDGDGIRSVPLGSFSSASGVAIQGDGKIVVGGTANVSANDFAVVRLTSAGALDTSFSGDGIQITDLGGTDDYARALRLRSDGKIVLAGNNYNWLWGGDVALARYNTDGSLDTAFGNGGTLSADIGSGNDYAMAMTLDTEGRIVTAGSAGGDVAVARFVPQSRVEVRNVAPVLGISGNPTIEINTPYTLNLSSTDVGADTIVRWNITWGDGTPEQLVNGDPASVPHTYTGNPRSYTITATATDEDGTFSATPLLIDTCKCGWGFRETGGSPGGAARAVADPTTVLLTEGDSFDATLWKNITITPEMTEVSVIFTNLAFQGIDASDINDAFEIAFVDAAGNSLVPTIGPGRDTFFNITEGVGMARGTGVTFDGERVGLDITALPDGTVGRLEIRLINNDGDFGSSTAVRILCDNQNAHQVLWGVNEQTGSLFAMWNYHSAAATFVDYGLVYTMQGTPPVATAVGNNIEALTVDGDGVAYMVRNSPVGGIAAPVLLKVDVDDLVYGNQVIATVVGRIPLTFNAAQDNISEVSFDPITGKLFALFKDQVDSGTDPVDRVLVINKSNAAILEDLGPMTGMGTSVTEAESFAFDGQGRLFVADNDTDGLYEVSPITGDIIAVVDSNLKNNPNFTGFASMKIEGLAFDPATDDLIASDDDNDRLLAFKTDATNTRVLENLAAFGLPDVEGMDFVTMYQLPPERRAVWTVDQDDGSLMVFQDYRTATAGMDLGQVRVTPAAGGAPVIVTNLAAMAVDSDGKAYIALNGNNAGYTGPSLLVLDLMQIHTLPTSVPLATVAGRMTVASGEIVGLAIHPTSGDLYALRQFSGTDELYRVNKSTGALTLVGAMTNTSPAASVGTGEALAFDASGNLYVSDEGDNDVYRVSTTNGAILSIYDASTEGGIGSAQLKGMGFDPISGKFIAVDTTGDRFVELTSGDGGNVAITGGPIPDTMEDPQGMDFFPQSAVGGVIFQPGGNPPVIEGPGSGTFAGNLDPSDEIRISDLSNVAAHFNVTYGRTSFNDAANVLYAHIHLARASATSIRGPLLVGVRGITAPGVRLHDRHGVTSSGISYYDISSLLTNGETSSASDVIDVDIAFDDPSGVGFGYELVILGHLNEAPFFTSNPYAGQQGQATPVEINVNNYVLEVVAKNSNQLRYTLTGQDPDNDAFSFSIVSGPANMSIQTIAGKPTLVWTPTAPGDVGSHYVRLRITDVHGLYDPSKDQVLTVRVVTGANRAPRFTTDPIVFAYAGRVYTYDSDAFDPDGDPLNFSAPVNPGGTFAIGAGSGIVTWTPTFAQIGQSIPVTLRVGDQQSPELSATQEYNIVVLEDPDVPQPGLPDLTISNILIDGLSCDAQHLRAQGIVSATVRNLGPGSVDAPFNVLFFEDLDFNGQFSAAQDHVLGSTRVEQRLLSSATINVAGILSGDLLFAGAHVWAFVDSANVITESNETNNTDRSRRDCKVVVPPGGFDPAVEWSVQEFDTLPGSTNVMSTPAVADVNEDGMPDIIFVTYGGGQVVRAVSGNDGTLLWTANADLSKSIQAENNVTVGDIDGDGHLEVLVSGGNNVLQAFEHDGTFKWTSVLAHTVRWGAASLADLDGDGDVEVVVGATAINGSDGSIIWNGLNSGGTGIGDNRAGPLSIVADLDMDGSPEVIAGNSAYRADGSLYWNANTVNPTVFIPDGFAGVANFDGDNFPEIVLVSSGNVYLLEHDGTLIWGPVSIPTTGSGGAPTIADFDGDGQPEIGVAGFARYAVYETDGSLKWQAEISDQSSESTGSSVFDFEGDGSAEVVYADEHYLRIYRGTDGTVLFQIPIGSNTAYELPVIADVDNDGNAEIVVVANTSSGDPRHGIFVIGDLNDTWVPTRKIWNQESYHITNINDDGTVPQHETASWLVHNSYRLNTITDPNFDPQDAPDLIPSFVRVQQVLSETKYTARIGNAGNLFAPTGVRVAFYNGDPNLGGTLIGTVLTTGQIQPGHYEDVTLTVSAAPIADLWVVADDDGTGTGRVRECNENNNAYSLIAGSAPITPNDPPVITSRPVDHVDEHEQYYYDVNATDPNGNALLYELVNKPARMTIDPVTGEIRWAPRSSEIGAHFVLVRVSDGRGGTALQRFTVTVTTTNEAPEITSVPLGPAKINSPYQYDVEAEDANGDVLFYSVDAISAGRGISINLETGLLAWTPTVLGSYPIEITVSDGRGGIAVQRFILPVVAENTPPHIITQPEGPIYLNENWTYQLSATDIEDGNTPDPDLRFSLDSAGANLGMTVNPTTGLLSWVPRSTGTFTVTVTVTDSGGASASQVLSLPVERRPLVNLPAQIDSTPTGPAMTDRPWEYLVEASDPEGDPISLSLLSMKDANGNTLTGYQLSFPGPGKMLVKWTPAAGVAAPVRIEVRALDSHNAGETQAFNLPVLDNAPPIIIRAVSQAGANINQPGTYDFDVIDYNGDNLTFQLLDINGAPVTAQFTPASLTNASDNPDDPDTVQFTYTPTAVGTKELRLRVMDNFGGVVEHTLRLIVNDGAQHGPTASLTARRIIAANTTFSAQVVASDPNNDHLIYTLTFVTGDPTKPQPTGMTIDRDTGLITWTPTGAQITADLTKPYIYFVHVSDGTTIVDLGPVDLTVVARLTNSAPIITSDPSGIRASGDRPLIYNARATDPDNDPITWTLVEGPVTSHINAQSGEFVWQPADDEFGRDQVARIQASDPYGAASIQTIILKAEETFVPGNSPPRITSTPPMPGPAGDTYTYIVHATDPDGERITFSISPTSPNASGITITGIDATTARVTWVNPPASATRDFTILATDERGAFGGQRIVLGIGVGNVETPPTITSTPTFSVMKGQTYNYQVLANDPDGAITYTVQVTTEAGAPVTWLTIGSSSGLLTGATTTVAVGNYIVRVIATEGGSSATQRYTLAVVDPATNAAPVIQPANPLPAAVGQSFTYDVLAQDPNGDDITFWLVDTNGNLVTELNGLRIAAGGRVTWTVPTGATNRTFTVRAVDAPGAYSQQSFSIVIVADQAPTVSLRLANSGAPEAGDTVGFVVDASDDVGVADLRVVLNTPWTGSVTLSVAPNGLATYVLPRTVAGQQFTAVATVVDGAGHSVSTAPLTVTVANVDTAAPVVSVSNVDWGLMINGPTPVIGQVYDPDDNLVYYSIIAHPINGGSPVTVFKQGTFNGSTRISGVGGFAQDDVITSLSPLGLSNGSYAMEVFAQDATGKSSSLTFGAEVESPFKLGSFSLSFVDMTTNVAGIPITITRRYDTLKASEHGDFGYGWTMEITQGTLAVDVPGGGDELLGDSGYEAPYRAGTRISITLPGGEQYNFTAIPYVVPAPWGVGGFLGLFDTYVLGFQPDVGQVSKLDLIGGHAYGVPNGLRVPPHLGDEILSAMVYYDEDTGELREAGLMGGGTPFNPASADIDLDFLLTTKDGTKYEFDSATGKLRTVTEPNGNELRINGNDLTTFDADGTQTSEISIVYEPGPGNQKRVHEIRDSQNNFILYEYDTKGNLAVVTDRTNRKSRFFYSELHADLNDPEITKLPEHVLTTIKDHENVVSLLRIGFFKDGKVKAVRDASNTRQGLDYTIDGPLVGLPAGYVVEVINQYNNSEPAQVIGVTEVARDGFGNIARQMVRENLGVDGLPNTSDDPWIVSVFEYDQNGRDTSRWQPFRTLGNTRYTAAPTVKMSTIIYDQSGNPIEDRDIYNNVTKFEYDAAGRPTVITNALNKETISHYDSKGNKTEVIDAVGNSTTFTHDSNGNVRTVTDALNRVVSDVTYNTQGLKQASTNVNGFTQNYGYDAYGNRQTESYIGIDPNTHLPVTMTYTTEYDLEGRMTDTTDIQGNDSTMGYDTAGRTSTYSNKWGETDDYIYDANGNPVRHIFADGSMSETVFDSLGRAIYTTSPHPSGVTISDGLGMVYDETGRIKFKNKLKNVQIVIEPDPLYPSRSRSRLVGTPTLVGQGERRYDSKGRLELSIEPDGMQTRYEYDDLDRQTALILDAAGTTPYRTEYQYDALGRAYWTKTPDNLITRNTYDDVGRVIRTTYNDGTFTSTAYDKIGRVVSTTDALSRTTDYIYDDVNNDRTIVEPAVQDPNTGLMVRPTIFYDYDSFDHLVAVTDANNHTTQFVYDASGRMVSRKLPLLQTETWTYGNFTNTEGDTAEGVLLSHTDAANRRVEYEYDDQGRVDKEKWFAAGAPTPERIIDILYDGRGGLDKRIDSVSGTVDYDFDGKGRLTRRATPQGIVNYEWDDQTDRMVRMYTGTLPNPITDIQYQYDHLGRLEHINVIKQDSLTVNQTTTYVYGLHGGITSVVLPNGVTGTFTYNPQTSRLTDIAWTKPGQPDVTFHYEHNNVGQRTRMVSVNGAASRTVDYVYDNLGHLTQETINGTQVITYKYDLMGNRLQVSDTVNGVTTSHYDDNDRLDTETKGNTQTTYQYDNTGALTTKIINVSGAETGRTVYTYDARGQLKDVNLDADAFQELNYTYDAEGNLISRTYEGVSRTYVLDLRSPTGYSQVIEEWTAGDQKASFVYGLSLISQQLDGAPTNYVLHDGLMSVVAFTNTSGVVSDRWSYDSFGAAQHTGTTANVHLLSGERWDAELGMYELRARRYNPANGRFSSADPLESTEPGLLNSYLYANADPINLVDPSGQSFLTGLLATIGILATAASIILPAVATGMAAKQLLDVADFVIAIREGLDAGWLELEDFMPMHLTAQMMGLELAHRVAAGALEFYKIALDVTSFGQVIGFMETAGDIGGFIWKNITEEDGTWTGTVQNGDASNIEKTAKIILNMHRHHVIPRAALAHIDDAWDLGRGFAKANPNLMDAPYQLHEAMFSWNKAGKILAPTTARTTKAVIKDFGGAEGYMGALGEFYKDLQSKPIKLPNGGFTDPKNYKGIYDAFKKAKAAMPNNPFAGV